MSLKVVGSDVGHPMTLAVVHLSSGTAQARVKTRSSILEETVRRSGETGVLILGDTNCKDDEAMDVCKKNQLRGACYTGSSWGSSSNRYDASAEYEGFGL